MNESKRHRRTHGVQLVHQDRRGCHHLRSVLLSRKARRELADFGSYSADRYSSNRRYRNHYLSLVEMEARP